MRKNMLKTADIIIYGGIIGGSFGTGFYKGLSKAQGVVLPEWVNPTTTYGLPLVSAAISMAYLSKRIKHKHTGTIGDGVGDAFDGLAQIALSAGTAVVTMAAEGAGQLAGYVTGKTF